MIWQALGALMVAGLLLAACSPAAVSINSPSPAVVAAATSSPALSATLTAAATQTLTWTATPLPAPTGTATPTRTASPTATGSPVSGTATTPAGTPTPAPVGMLPGLAPSQVEAQLQGLGYVCGGPSFSGGVFQWSCELIQGQGWFTVLIYSRTADTVDKVIGQVERLDGVANDAVSLQLLDLIASLPYTGAEPELARGWVEATLPTIKQYGDIQSTTFGGVKFQLYGLPTARNLQVGTFAVP